MLDRLEAEIPPGLTLRISDNYTSMIDDRLDVVLANAWSGAALVILVLLVLSGFRQAMLAVAGMPVSFLMATLLMDQTDMSINVVSTFGLLKHESAGCIRGYIEQLAAGGFVERTGDPYPVLRLTPAGAQLLKGQCGCELFREVEPRSLAAAAVAIALPAAVAFAIAARRLERFARA